MTDPAPASPDAAEAPTGPEAHLPSTRIGLTDAAVSEMREMIDDAGLTEEGGLRLSAHTGAGCSAPLQYGMTLEEAPDPDDTVLSAEGVRLFLDPESAWVLDGLRIDYVTSSPMGEGFAFRHPNGRNGRAC